MISGNGVACAAVIERTSWYPVTAARARGQTGRPAAIASESDAAFLRHGHHLLTAVGWRRAPFVRGLGCQARRLGRAGHDAQPAPDASVQVHHGHVIFPQEDALFVEQPRRDLEGAPILPIALGSESGLGHPLHEPLVIADEGIGNAHQGQQIGVDGAGRLGWKLLVGSRFPESPVIV